MKVLVAFGTTEGQTRKLAHHIEASIQANDHTCEVHNCEDKDTTSDVATFDAVIVAGSVHQQHHQPTVSEYVKKHLSVLQTKPTAFISVSLSVTFDAGKDEAAQYVTKFTEETSWTPTQVHLAAGAIRFLEYDFFKELTIHHVVLKGRKMPPHSGTNPEFTDWNALDAFVTSFLNDVATVAT